MPRAVLQQRQNEAKISVNLRCSRQKTNAKGCIGIAGSRSRNGAKSLAGKTSTGVCSALTEELKQTWEQSYPI